MTTADDNHQDEHHPNAEDEPAFEADEALRPTALTLRSWLPAEVELQAEFD